MRKVESMPCSTLSIPLLTFLLLFKSQWALAEKETIVYLDSGEYPPYYSQSMPEYGIVSRIVTQAFALEGLKVKIQWYPWARAYEHVINGVVHGSFTGAKTPKREKVFYFSDPIIKNEIVFFHLKSHAFTWQKYQDLSETLLGGTLGYSYSRDFIEAEESGIIKVERVPDDQTNFRKLLGNRVKAFPISKSVGLYKLNQHFTPTDISSLSCHSRPVVANDVHLILSKKLPESKQLLKRFNRGLQKLKLSGRYAELSKVQVESRIVCSPLPVTSNVRNASNE